jgi:hypothetical protein
LTGGIKYYKVISLTFSFREFGFISRTQAHTRKLVHFVRKFRIRIPRPCPHACWYTTQGFLLVQLCHSLQRSERETMGKLGTKSAKACDVPPS